MKGLFFYSFIFLCVGANGSTIGDILLTSMQEIFNEIPRETYNKTFFYKKEIKELLKFDPSFTIKIEDSNITTISELLKNKNWKKLPINLFQFVPNEKATSTVPSNFEQHVAIAYWVFHTLDFIKFIQTPQIQKATKQCISMAEIQKLANKRSNYVVDETQLNPEILEIILGEFRQIELSNFIVIPKPGLELTDTAPSFEEMKIAIAKFINDKRTQAFKDKKQQKTTTKKSTKTDKSLQETVQKANEASPTDLLLLQETLVPTQPTTISVKNPHEDLTNSLSKLSNIIYALESVGLETFFDQLIFLQNCEKCLAFYTLELNFKLIEIENIIAALNSPIGKSETIKKIHQIIVNLVQMIFEIDYSEECSYILALQQIKTEYSKPEYNIMKQISDTNPNTPQRLHEPLSDFALSLQCLKNINKITEQPIENRDSPNALPVCKVFYDIIANLAKAALAVDEINISWLCNK